MQLPLYMLFRFYFRSTGTCNLKLWPVPQSKRTRLLS